MACSEQAEGKRKEEKRSGGDGKKNEGLRGGRGRETGGLRAQPSSTSTGCLGDEIRTSSTGEARLEPFPRGRDKSGSVCLFASNIETLKEGTRVA
jgi:hypothetical protein